MKIFFGFLALLLLTGCASLGVGFSKLDTANKQIAAKLIELDGFVTMTRDLLAADVITPGQAEKAHTALQSGLDALNQAQALIASTGDPLSAKGALATAEVAVNLAIAILTERAKTNVVYSRSTRRQSPHLAGVEWYPNGDFVAFASRG